MPSHLPLLTLPDYTMNQLRQLRRAALRLLLAGALPASTLAAQAPVPSDTSRDAHALFTAGDAALAVGFAGLTVAMFPLDRSFAGRLRNESSKASRFLDRTATGFEVLAVPGALVLGPALYLYGRQGHHSRVEDLGWHTTEAIGATLVATEILKGALGRSRPWVTADTNPRDFAFGRGFTGEERSSFPSAHAAVAFAAAASLTSELQRDWPGHAWVAGPILYGGAALVGLGRMYHDKHWASDVALGAGVGTLIGLKTVRYAHAHPGNLVDRVILHASVVPDGHGGGALSWNLPLSH